MATGDDGDDGARSDVALAPTTPGAAHSTRAAGATETSPGRVIAPPTIAGDDSMLRQGDAVDRYRIEGYLGRGGMGVVYRARDPDLDRALAIKLVRSRHRGGDRMLREAQAMARLDHPNVVPIFDVGVRGEQIFLVMPFMPGGTLGDWCRATPRPWHEVVRRYVEAGRGLEAAHRAGIVHRDFKPDNVLIDSNGEVHVADFGLARAQRDESSDGEPIVASTSGPFDYALTHAGELLGTPAYMAPEQLDGKTVDARADQFSFCVALHEGLYGKRPFALPRGGNIVDQRRAIADAHVRPAPADRDVPPWIRDAIVRGIREDPAARWPSITALLDELQRGLLRRGRGRRVPWVAIGGGAAAVAAIAVAAVVAMSSSSRSAARTSATRHPEPPPTEDRTRTERQLTVRGDVDNEHLAPDDSAVVAMAGDDLVVVPLAAGAEPKTLAKDVTGVASISWSPDATHVMLVTHIDLERSNVELFDVATGAREHHELPVWPRAVMVASREVASAHATTRDLRITSLDGAVAARRCPIPGDYLYIHSLAAAGGALFVTVTHADDVFSVIRTDRYCTQPHVVLDRVQTSTIVIDSDGSHVGAIRQTDGRTFLERTPVTAGTTAPVRTPIPDDATGLVGRTASGALVATTGALSWQLVRIEGEPARVTDVITSGTKAVMLEVSPDGARLARVDDREAQELVMRVVPLDDADALPAPSARFVRQPVWSPDGTRIAGLAPSGGEGDDYMIAVVPAAGGPYRQFAVSPRAADELVWLDDRRLAYRRFDNRTFIAIDAAATADRKPEELLDPDAGWAIHLAVNPVDGSLAVFWNRVGARGVYVIPRGGTPVLVAPTEDTILDPEWSPDGKTLYLFDPPGGTIDRVDIATSERERVFTSSDPGTYVSALWPQRAGRLIAMLSRATSDLVVFE